MTIDKWWKLTMLAWKIAGVLWLIWFLIVAVKFGPALWVWFTGS